MGSGVPTCGFLVDPDGQRGLELAAWTVVESWGAALFGDPCHACGFDWSLTPEQAIAVIADAPEVFERATAGVDGDARQGGWSVAEYTSHVADNLRQWSERVQAARVAGQTTVAGYDPDQLAIARNYAAIPLSVALWSLHHSATAWVDVLSGAVAQEVVLWHATRGRQRAQDVARNNAHDAMHHLWDIQRITGR
ncbi:hypothetical protein [Nostocoides sp.]|uniref:hypothetical protein n=1 Tax=Nostocoides sp. TaxID=1917966 RepID=UPI002C717DC3|nr:hypothetical protein [Tetrasphaera sp.]